MTLAKKFIYQTILIGSALSFALGVNYLYAWTGPTGVAPNNNVSAPLNIGTNAQVKDGNVSVGASANGLTTLGLSVYGAQYIKGWLKVGNTGTPTQLLELSGTSGVDGIKFPDGTVQTSAASGPRVIQGGALIHAQSVTINAGWGTVNVTGTSCGPSGTCPMGGVIYKSGGSVKASAFVGDYNFLNNSGGGGYDLTLTSGVQSCFKTNAFCVTYTAASDTLSLTTAGVLSYVAYAL